MKPKYFWLCFFAAIAALMPSCTKNAGQYNQSVISVVGTGTVLAQPDMIQMSIMLSKTAQTTKAAQEEVSKMVRQALGILKEAKIEDKNINTASLTFNSEYEYNGRRVLVGQRAEQRISFSIEGINDGSEKASAIIDQLIQINGIALDHINFSVKNNTDYFVKSRELAFQKAVEKADQYAGLSNLKIVKVLSISEEGNQQIAPVHKGLFNQRLAYASEAKLDESGTSALPTGEMEITTSIAVSFLLK